MDLAKRGKNGRKSGKGSGGKHGGRGENGGQGGHGSFSDPIWSDDFGGYVFLSADDGSYYSYDEVTEIYSPVTVEISPPDTDSLLAELQAGVADE